MESNRETKYKFENITLNKFLNNFMKIVVNEKIILLLLNQYPFSEFFVYIFMNY